MVLALTSAIAGPTPLDTKVGFVMASEHARDLLHQCSRDTPQGVQDVWRPDADQIAELEFLLPAALARVKPEHRAVYGRQYAGFVIAGHKAIYVNAFPVHLIDFDGTDIAASDLKTAITGRAVTICDGGADYFGVLYDPKTKSFTQFRFNGFA